MLDCDEYIIDLDVRGFDALITYYPQCVGMLSRKNHYEMNGTDSVYTDDVERFFNKKLFHYEAIIHEQVRALDFPLNLSAKFSSSPIAVSCGIVTPSPEFTTFSITSGKTIHI